VQAKHSVIVQIAAHTAQFVAGINQLNNKVSGFEKSLMGLRNQLIGTFGAYQVIGAIQSSITTLAEYDKVITQVGVITGASSEDFNKLDKSARSLGSTTQYTAKQVAELQLEFGRLGFSTKEILDSTRATVNLATATGEGLARSAEIAGSTLRAFQMDASQMGRVTDIMAASLNSSALTLDSFADAIKYVSPVAKATNVSLEETSAMMSVLADAGIKGTQAGTSLRRIFTMLTDGGKPLQERLEELSKAGITLAGANDEVGLYAQTALLVLANQKERITELTKAYRNSIGATDSMARAMEDNLATSITKVGTAWDALILSFKESKGVLKDVAEAAADALNLMAGGTGADIIKFNSLLKGVQNSISLNQPIRTEQFKNLVRLADKLGKKLGYTWDESGKKILSVFEITRSGQALGPSNTPIIPLQEAMNKIIVANAEKEAQRLDTLKKQNEEYQESIKLALEYYKIRNKWEMEAISVREFNQGASGRSSKLLSDVLSGNSSKEDLKEGIDSLRKNQQEEFNKTIERSIELKRKDIEAIKDRNYAYASMADQVGDVLTRMIAKEFEFADAFRMVTASILDQIQKRVIANIIEGKSKLFAINPMNPFLGIAAITAGFAITKGLLMQIGKNNSSNVRGSSYEGNVEFRLRGKDLVGSLRNTGYANGITG